MKPEIKAQMTSFSASAGDRIDPVAQALRRLYLRVELCPCQFDRKYQGSACEQCKGDESLIEEAWEASGPTVFCNKI